MSRVNFGAKPLMLPQTFDPCNNTYVALGDVVGNAFKDGMSLK